MSTQLAQALKSAIAELDWLPTSDATQAIWERQQKTLGELRKELAAFEAAPQQAQAPTQAEVDLNEALLEVDYWKRIAAHLAAPVGYKLVPIREAQQAQAPDGWQLVPVEPTPEMKKAAVVYANGNAVYKNVAREALEIEESIYGEVYAAMLSAAPQQGSNHGR